MQTHEEVTPTLTGRGDIARAGHTELEQCRISGQAEPSSKCMLAAGAVRASDSHWRAPKRARSHQQLAHVRGSARGLRGLGRRPQAPAAAGTGRAAPAGPARGGGRPHTEGATSWCLSSSTVRRTALKTGRLAGARGVSGAMAASMEPTTTALGALLSAHCGAGAQRQHRGG
jgi:hypothetical protein